MALNALKRQQGLPTEEPKKSEEKQEIQPAAPAVEIDDDWDAPAEPPPPPTPPQPEPIKVASYSEQQRRRAERKAQLEAQQRQKEEKEKAKKKTVDLPAQFDPKLNLEHNVPVGLRPEDIESYRALGVETKLKYPKGEVWIVPRLTGRTDRIEVSIDHAKTLALISLAFPGAQVVEVTRDLGDDDL